MITQKEVEDLALQHGVPLASVEKDYVMGWLLWAIASNRALSSNLVLKGGNCLRKVYFADTRFSDDLDFTAYRIDPADAFRQHLQAVCSAVSSAAGIEFDQSRLVVDSKKTPDPDCQALDGRVYFKGFAGDSSLTMRIKFDVTDYERIILPVQQHPILHGYSDALMVGQVRVPTYSLEEVLAEKLRSWIQRTRSRDLFDVVKIVQSGKVPIIKRNILAVFLQKTLFKGIAVNGRDELLVDEKFATIEKSWSETIVCPRNALVVAANAVRLFREFVTALFDSPTLEALGERATGRGGFARGGYGLRSGLREAIIQAGRARQLIRMRYSGKDRDIEPYSFKYKVRKEDGRGVEYFYGWDRTRGQTIKSFFVERIENVSILPTRFVPRDVVEF
jgi:predicted nucleotidyltransferase component of viral defense system